MFTTSKYFTSNSQPRTKKGHASCKTGFLFCGDQRSIWGISR